MKREVIRVEPLSTWLENWKAPTSAVTRHGETIYVSAFPPFDLEAGEVVQAPIERQTELVLEQMKLCLRAAGTDMGHVLKCNVYCTSVDKFAAVKEVYRRYFPKEPPARIFKRDVKFRRCQRSSSRHADSNLPRVVVWIVTL